MQLTYRTTSLSGRQCLAASGTTSGDHLARNVVKSPSRTSPRPAGRCFDANRSAGRVDVRPFLSIGLRWTRRARRFGCWPTGAGSRSWSSRSGRPAREPEGRPDGSCDWRLLDASHVGDHHAVVVTVIGAWPERAGRVSATKRPEATAPGPLDDGISSTTVSNRAVPDERRATMRGDCAPRARPDGLAPVVTHRGPLERARSQDAGHSTGACNTHDV